MSVIYMRINNQFYINGFALSLAFKQRLGEIGKSPIPSVILFKFFCPRYITIMINQNKTKMVCMERRLLY